MCERDVKGEEGWRWRESVGEDGRVGRGRKMEGYVGRWKHMWEGQGWRGRERKRLVY